MHDADVGGPIEKLDTPIKSRVAPADDHDALVAIQLGIRDDVVDPTSVPRLRARLRQLARRERTDARRDDDRPSRKAVLVGDEHEMAILFLEPDDALREMDRLIELARLFRE